jgi:hypothetical protein
MPAKAPAKPAAAAKKSFDEHPILFQKFFKSVGPRTYAAQIKQASNGNQYMVLTEGYRKSDSDEVRKTRIFLYSEDFVQFFRMLHEAAQWIKANPLPDEIKKKRDQYWAKHHGTAKLSGRSPKPAGAKPPGGPILGVSR